ncbi:intradiol ring-cleavage dioxygenase [Actinoplanes subtropicus]|uniref:intradiol ring-cleavage dioxygenase n=1 Tax=Actinoplanes subtropicus TaxID=543632 RepID=UPI000554CFA8|nr:intradiol ring-cleavage dioxygenase [Actinoplanes subtropicus]
MNTEDYVREVHDKGFLFDRRRLLGMLGGAGALAVAGGGLLGGGAAAAAAACATEVESETAGPFPADGSNGPDVRVLSGIVRSDIRSSFGTSTTVAAGVPLQFKLIVSNLSCAPLAGAAVYAWHCDRAGRYSLYSSGVTNENYLRGIQVTDSTGTVTFTSIYPACYSGRWPHIHFEVYSSQANATSGAGPIRKTSQIALPETISKTVYASATGYSQSVTNMSRITLSSDMVFGDDLAAREMATVTGSVSAGYVATLAITVDPTKTESGGRLSA